MLITAYLVAQCIIVIIVAYHMLQDAFIRPLLLHKALCHPKLKSSQEVSTNIEVGENPSFEKKALL
jgi:hypothetical protein